MKENNSNIIDIYRKQAKNFEFYSNFYFLIGYRFRRDQKNAINALNLSEGDTVVDVGCGTGLNFQPLLEKIGNSGKIIGLDITDRMLEQAKKKVKQNKWKNIQLILCDAQNYKFPKNLDGVIATGVLTYSPKYDEIINNCYVALKSGKRFVMTDFKMPTGKTKIFSPLLLSLSKSLGVKKELMTRHPWKSVEKYFEKSYFKEGYGGFVYLSVGIKK